MAGTLFAAACSGAGPGENTGQGGSGGNAGGAGLGRGGSSVTVTCEGASTLLLSDELSVGHVAANDDEIVYTALVESDRPIGSIKRFDRHSHEVRALSEVENPVGLALTERQLVWAVGRPGYLAVMPREHSLLNRVNFGRTPYGLRASGNDVYFVYQDAMPAVLRLREGAVEPEVLVAGDVLAAHLTVVGDSVVYYDLASGELQVHWLASNETETIAELAKAPNGMTVDDTSIVWLEGSELVWLDRDSLEQQRLPIDDAQAWALELHDDEVYWLSGKSVRAASLDDGVRTLASCSERVTAIQLSGKRALFAARYGIFELELP